MFCSPFRRRRKRRRRLEEMEERHLTREEAWHLYLAKECLDLTSRNEMTGWTLLDSARSKSNKLQLKIFQLTFPQLEEEANYFTVSDTTEEPDLCTCNTCIVSPSAPGQQSY